MAFDFELFSSTVNLCNCVVIKLIESFGGGVRIVLKAVKIFLGTLRGLYYCYVIPGGRGGGGRDPNFFIRDRPDITLSR